MTARGVAGITLALVVTAFAEAASAQAAPPAITARRIHVITQDFAHSTCADCGVLVGGILGFEDRKRSESVARQFAFLESELPELDSRALLHEAFCRELAASADPMCAQVVVHDRPKSRDDARILVGPEGALLVTFAVEYMQGIGADGLRVIASISEPQADKPANPFLYLWYMTSPPGHVRASPLVPADQANAKQKAAREYWWTGSPSRIEKELRRAIADIAGMARIAVPHTGPDATDDQRKAWFQALPEVAELRAAGKTDCRGVMCGFRFIGVSEDRYWWAQPAEAIIIMSTPLVPER
jgi:hypothetical protein